MLIIGVVFYVILVYNIDSKQTLKTKTNKAENRIV